MRTTMKKLLLALLVAFLPVLSPASEPAETSYWTVQHAPVAATQATVSQAAVAGARHVARRVTVCVSGVADQGPLAFNLRDGASGAGTVLWTVQLAAPAGRSTCQAVEVNIVGTAGTAMTLESASAPAATNFATLSLNGFTTY